MKLIRIHHIDYVVRDLSQATAQYEKLFDVQFAPSDLLANRGVRVARFQIAGTWVALVQPTTPDSPVQRVLDTRGEGFFHVAYEVADVVAEASRLRSQGIGLINEQPRLGLEGWRLVDLSPSETFGVETQLVQPK